MVRIQGKEISDAVGMTMSEYLIFAGFNKAQVAVECDGKIIPKSKFDDTVIEDGQIIEIVSFVEGG